MTVKQLLASIDSDELSEWMVMERDYHIIQSGWTQAGIISSTVANAMAPRKGGKPYEPSDFMPACRKIHQSVDEIKNIFDSACRL